MILEIDNLTKNYGKFCALNSVSQTFKPGIYGLLGPNGAGKSTMMNMIAGVLTPTDGEITLDGKNIVSMGKEYRKIFGFMPQVTGYYSNFTARKFLKYIAALKGIKGKKEVNKRVDELLCMVNLTEFANKKVGGFSGGMKQRLGIAQALLNDPDIIIFDEPTAGLDPKERIRFKNLISEMSKDKIIILATHIVSDVESVADNILVLNKGKVVQSGTVSECLDAVKGKVYTLSVDEKDIPRLSERYSVVSMSAKGEDSYLRIVTDEKPEGGVISDKVTLEDLYIYHFGEGGKDA